VDEKWLFEHLIILLFSVKLKNIPENRVQHVLYKANIYVSISNKDLHYSGTLIVMKG
jgi:hypothetical protein